MLFIKYYISCRAYSCLFSSFLTVVGMEVPGDFEDEVSPYEFNILASACTLELFSDIYISGVSSRIFELWELWGSSVPVTAEIIANDGQIQRHIQLEQSKISIKI